MASLGSRKKNTDTEAATVESNAGSSISQPRASEADERTRLLPPPAAGGLEGYLSPDDPAVSFLPLLFVVLFL
jgi:hypothetical protein